MTPNINSPTAKELANKSIVELSCNVYQNALAVKEMVDSIDVDLVAGIADRVTETAQRAEEFASVADGAADVALQNADAADASATEARGYAEAAADVLDAAGDALAAKLDKVSNTAARPRVYAVSASGTQYMHTVSGSAEHHNRALAIYTDIGTLRSADPQLPDDLATKRYVDTFAGGGGGITVVNVEGGTYTIPDGHGAIIIATRLDQGTTHVFAVPSTSAAFDASITSTIGGLTMTAGIQYNNWFVEFNDSVWMTVVLI